MKNQAKEQVEKSCDGLGQRIDSVLEILKGEHGYDCHVEEFAKGSCKLLTQGNSFDILLASVVIKTLMKTKEGKGMVEDFYKQTAHNKKK